MQDIDEPLSCRGDLDVLADITKRTDRSGHQKSDLARRCILERSQGREGLLITTQELQRPEQRG